MPPSTQSCKLLTNGYKFDISRNGDLEYGPCCQYTGDFIQLPELKEVQLNYRNKLSKIDSYSAPSCAQCNFLESKDLKISMRQAAHLLPDNLLHVELQIDKTCNGGCIICSPQYSSFLRNEALQHDPLSIVPVISSTQDNLKLILETLDLDKVVSINFVGGEPLMSKMYLQLIQLIKNPGMVRLRYTTNGSIRPSAQLLEIWKKFKSVVINFSIDGIGDQFEYIRFPLKWDIVTANMFLLRDSEIPNMTYKINHVMTPVNQFYFDEFNEWRIRNFSIDALGNDIPFSFTPAAGPLSPTIISQALHTLLLTKYAKDSPIIRTVISFRNTDSAIVDHLDSIDRKRNLDWRAVFPDIVDALEQIKS